MLLVYDIHGDKHFGGDGTQWGISREDVNRVLEAYLTKNAAVLQAFIAQGNNIFYVCDSIEAHFGKDAVKAVKRANGREFTDFSIQLGVSKLSPLTVDYHSYPDEVTKYGISATKRTIKDFLPDWVTP